MSFDLKKVTERDTVLTFLNEHWMILLAPFLMYVLFSVLGVSLLWFGFSLASVQTFLGLCLAFFGLFVALAAQHWFFITLIALELSGWVVTPQRIIDFHFLPYVRHDMLYVSIRDVNEIEKQQRGLVKNFLHYGEVEIILASSPKPLLFKYVPYPGRFVDLVSNLQKSRE